MTTKRRPLAAGRRRPGGGGRPRRVGLRISRDGVHGRFYGDELGGAQSGANRSLASRSSVSISPVTKRRDAVAALVPVRQVLGNDAVGGERTSSVASSV
jgi:hypothetical protein